MSCCVVILIPNLRRNIDTKSWLVNGAIGTVQKISKNTVTVKFDHIEKPYDVDKVKSRFMVMKNFFVYRKQFPLILAYAVTIHKCQGLSLDCAIVDLSDQVFSAGMAYVALSRVRSLTGLYLSAFDPSSIIVSFSCLREVNRLRETFRKDLPLYDLPPQQTKVKANKRKLIGASDVPKAKKLIKLSTKTVLSKLQKTESGNKQPASKKRKSSDPLDGEKPAKKNRDPRDYDPKDKQVWPFRYHPVDEQWQRLACARVGLDFIRKFDVTPGGPEVDLTPPNVRTLKDTAGDGNCLFRALSYVITGSECQHYRLRTAIVRHMFDIEHLLVNNAGTFDRTSVSEYLSVSNMDKDKMWGTDVEIFTLSHLLSTNVFSWSTTWGSWQRHGPDHLDRSLNFDDMITDMSMYIYHYHNHYLVVRSIV